MKRPSVMLGILLCSLVGAASAHAQAGDPLKGTWAISTAGSAVIGTANTGSCAGQGTQPASLYDIRATFASGTISILDLGISMGGTTCTPVNFQGTGSYTIEDRGNGNFVASGTFSSSAIGRLAACQALSLTNAAFTAIGRIADHSMTITINGLDAGNYAEGQGASVTCTAPIKNLTGSGDGRKV